MFRCRMGQKTWTLQNINLASSRVERKLVITLTLTSVSEF